MRKLIIVALVVASFGAVLAEDVAPFQFGIAMPDAALEPGTTRINGWVTGIWTENPQSALSTSWINGSVGDSKGLSIGLVNYSENYAGVQFAFFNKTSGNFSGWQDGFFNYVKGNFKGLQSGFYNVASKMHGVQLGLINTSEKMYGVQIGVINLNISNKFFTEIPDELAPGMILVNWKF